MATQLQATAGIRGRKLRRNQIAELEAKMPSLGEMERQKAQQRMHDETMRFKRKEHSQNKAMAKKRMSMENMIAERQMGVEAAKFGFNVATSGGPTLGEIGGKVKGLFSGIGSNPMTSGYQSKLANASAVAANKTVGIPTVGQGITASQIQTGLAGTKSGFFGSMRPGAMIGGGLAGFGASRMVKGKKNRMLLGAGVGGLMSLFGGGGFDLGTTLGGALFGGLGGMV